MSNQGYYGQQQGYGGPPPQQYGRGPYAPPQPAYQQPPYQQPPYQQYQQPQYAPQQQQQRTSSNKGCFEVCIATLCCCFVAEEGCECCADCFQCCFDCC